MLGKLPQNWTNNNSESANHILKTATKWEITELATSINKVQDIIKSEQSKQKGVGQSETWVTTPCRQCSDAI